MFCRFGMHDCRGAAIWNQGYYFSTCARCGRDLVRPIDGRWRTPKGHKVVWRGRTDPLPQAGDRDLSPSSPAGHDIVEDPVPGHSAFPENARLFDPAPLPAPPPTESEQQDRPRANDGHAPGGTPNDPSEPSAAVVAPAANSGTGQSADDDFMDVSEEDGWWSSMKATAGRDAGASPTAGWEDGQTLRQRGG